MKKEPPMEEPHLHNGDEFPIGEIRRRLFVEGSDSWNGVVRDLTAELELEWTARAKKKGCPACKLAPFDLDDLCSTHRPPIEAQLKADQPKMKFCCGFHAELNDGSHCIKCICDIPGKPHSADCPLWVDPDTVCSYGPEHPHSTGGCTIEHECQRTKKECDCRGNSIGPTCKIHPICDCACHLHRDCDPKHVKVDKSVCACHCHLK